MTGARVRDVKRLVPAPYAFVFTLLTWMSSRSVSPVMFADSDLQLTLIGRVGGFILENHDASHFAVHECGT
jgi:hypothetical protein